MGILRRGEKVEVVIVDKEGEEFIETKAVKDGNLIIDPFLGRSYAIATKPVKWIKGRRTKLKYFLDADKGCTIGIEKDDELLKLKTNPDLIGKVIDSRLIQQAFAIKPEMRIVLIAFIIGIAIGWFVGLFF
jgi:hypothetical protein